MKRHLEDHMKIEFMRSYTQSPLRATTTRYRAQFLDHKLVREILHSSCDVLRVPELGYVEASPLLLRKFADQLPGDVVSTDTVHLEIGDCGVIDDYMFPLTKRQWQQALQGVDVKQFCRALSYAGYPSMKTCGQLSDRVRIVILPLVVSYCGSDVVCQSTFDAIHTYDRVYRKIAKCY